MIERLFGLIYFYLKVFADSLPLSAFQMSFSNSLAREILNGCRCKLAWEFLA